MERLAERGRVWRKERWLKRGMGEENVINRQEKGGKTRKELKG